MSIWIFSGLPLSDSGVKKTIHLIPGYTFNGKQFIWSKISGINCVTMNQSGGGMASWNTWKLTLGVTGESHQDKDMYHMYQGGSWEQKEANSTNILPYLRRK